MVADELVTLPDENKAAPEVMRRVVARVEVDGEEREMVFLTNKLLWSPNNVADLYRCRWEIEVFFKQIKQNPRAPSRGEKSICWNTCVVMGQQAGIVGTSPRPGVALQAGPSQRR